jgi:hypothetical protein
MFVYGMWFGLVYRRWNLIGLLVFVAAQATVAVAGVIAGRPDDDEGVDAPAGAARPSVRLLKLQPADAHAPRRG